MLGCSQNENIPIATCDELSLPSGAKTFLPCHRAFDLDPNKNFLMVKIYGTGMGTPDQASVEQLLASALGAELITDYDLLEVGIEGGGTYCAAIAEHADRTQLFRMFIDLQTDTVLSSYSVISVDNCESN